MSHTVSSTCNVPFYDRPQTPLSLLPFIENAQAHTLVKDEEVWDGYVFALLLRMRGSITENKRLMKNEEGDEVPFCFGYSRDCTARIPRGEYTYLAVESDFFTFQAVLHWEIRRSAGNGTQELVHKVATKFRVVPDSIYALVPVAKNTDLINTGVLSGQQSATSMRVFTASLGGVIRDVTSRSHCISAESRVLKTSPTCTSVSVYVDGSELRGMQNMKIHVHFEKWTTFIAYTVWYPRLPITVSMVCGNRHCQHIRAPSGIELSLRMPASPARYPLGHSALPPPFLSNGFLLQLWLRDSVLNSISGWPITVWKSLEGERHHKGAAKQFACGNRYQQSELRVFASFQVSDERTGERMYLSGHRDVMFDVTSLAADSIVSSDRAIVTVRNHNNRVIVQAVQPGEARIVVKAQAPNIDFGSTAVTVSAEEVTVSRLTALPVVEMNLNIEPTAGKRAQYDVVTALETSFQHRYQHGSFFYQLFYSDDSMEFLDDVTVTDFNLSSQSSDERVLALAHKVQNGVDIIALDDLSDPYIQLELRPPAHCTDTDAAPLAILQVPMRVQFDGLDSSRLVVARFPTNGSRYSQKSTVHVAEQSSPSYDDNTQTSISYRGSEISVFISPTPVVTVHADYEPPCGGSWRASGKSRTRAARHALIDSSSDHNLARVVARSGKELIVQLMERRNRVAEQYVEFEEAYHGLRGHERKRGLS
ncbi:hypothetical protein ANCDUO_05208 [Ancylostoma duodenale]|uniref:Transmembrane protein family 132 middle domain-containing protein n=1 Tax=Ancylostoma duodenale TaxID=51022 RepID=A0A0C2DP79_9BILA|nr:hypothetical protein ANCDUO_05208 [Ancylostoma duodenale]